MLRGQRFVLNLVGLSIAAVLYLISLSLTSPSMDLCVGIATSFVFVAVADLLSVGRDRLTNRARIRFFGTDLTRVETVLVYPNFVLHEDVLATLAAQDQPVLFARPHSAFQHIARHRADIPSITAANDIQALLYVADAFESTANCPNRMMLDSEAVQTCNRSFISFGLSSNDCTHLYLNEDPDPMFSIQYDADGTECVRLRTGQEYRSSARRQYGVIVRYAPDPEEHPGRRWFLVAGRGPVGTTGAAWYLATRWRALAKQVPGDRNFVAVISTGSYTDHHPALEETLIDYSRMSMGLRAAAASERIGDTVHSGA